MAMFLYKKLVFHFHVSDSECKYNHLDIFAVFPTHTDMRPVSNMPNRKTSKTGSVRCMNPIAGPTAQGVGY